MKMKKNELDPLRESIERGWKVKVHTEDRDYHDVTPLAATGAYLAFEDPDDASGTSFIVKPWHQITEVGYVSSEWIDAQRAL